MEHLCGTGMIRVGSLHVSQCCEHWKKKCFSCTLPSNLYFEMTLKQQGSCVARDGVLHSRIGAEGVPSFASNEYVPAQK